MGNEPLTSKLPGVLLFLMALLAVLAAVTPLTGSAFIIAAVLLSLVGVHPIITISILGSLLGNAAYNPDLLGACMLMMWGTSIVGSPLSGINLAIQGRFGVSSFAIMRWNAGYVLAMALVCALALHVYHYLYVTA